MHATQEAADSHASTLAKAADSHAASRVAHMPVGEAALVRELEAVTPPHVLIGIVNYYTIGK